MDANNNRTRTLSVTAREQSLIVDALLAMHDELHRLASKRPHDETRAALIAKATAAGELSGRIENGSNC